MRAMGREMKEKQSMAKEDNEDDSVADVEADRFSS